MPNWDELKNRNAPSEPQTITVPYLPQVSAIPTEQWNTMLHGKQVTVSRLQELGRYVANLPTTKAVEDMMAGYYSAVYQKQSNNLVETIRSEHTAMKSDLLAQMTTTTMTSKLQTLLTGMEDTLRHRDMWEPKLKLKWTGIGALISTAFFILLKLLKIW